VNLSLLNTEWYIQQLRDLEPRVPITLTDQQIDALPAMAQEANRRSYQAGRGDYWMVKDFGVQHIVDTNNLRRPIYIAVTVPNSDRSVQTYDARLSMEGLVFRIMPEPVKDRVDVEKTRKNLNELYRYEGLVVRDPTGKTIGTYDEEVFKDDNATKLVQNYSAAFARVALALLDQGKAEEALVEMDKAAVISPYFPGIAIARGLILEQLGRAAEAHAHYESMMEAYPGDWQLAYRMGELLVDQDSIRADFMSSLQLAPQDQFFPYQGLASAYYQLGMYEDAAEVLQRWLTLHPDDSNVRPLYEDLRRSLREGRTPGAEDSLPADGLVPDGD
jgi:tetratricopeptide (TPR) repeat protein